VVEFNNAVLEPFDETQEPCPNAVLEPFDRLRGHVPTTVGMYQDTISI
jgi:hypothetical protein